MRRRWLYWWLAVCVVAAVWIAQDARGMVSKGFVTPTGKITCQLMPGRNIYCMYLPRRRKVGLSPYGKGYVPDWWPPPLMSDRVLEYGQVWRTAKRPYVTCSTYASGVTCANRFGHGFVLTWFSVQTW